MKTYVTYDGLGNITSRRTTNSPPPNSIEISPHINDWQNYYVKDSKLVKKPIVTELETFMPKTGNVKFNVSTARKKKIKELEDYIDNITYSITFKSKVFGLNPQFLAYISILLSESQSVYLLSTLDGYVHELSVDEIVELRKQIVERDQKLLKLKREVLLKIKQVNTQIEFDSIDLEKIFLDFK